MHELQRPTMPITKERIATALAGITLPGSKETLSDKGALQNVQVFDKQVDVDVQLANPTLQARKALESQIKTTLQQLDAALEVKVNIRVTAPSKPEPIKGQPIPGIDNIIAIASGKRWGRKIYGDCQFGHCLSRKGMQSRDIGC